VKWRQSSKKDLWGSNKEDKEEDGNNKEGSEDGLRES